MRSSDNQWATWPNKFQLFTQFSSRHVGSLGGTPTWRLHTRLCKFVQNISTNMWSAGKPTDLKLGMSYLSTSYADIIIYWLNTLNGFRVIFFNRVTVQPKNSGALLYQLSYQANRELVMLWVRNILAESAECKWIYISRSHNQGRRP